MNDLPGKDVIRDNKVIISALLVLSAVAVLTGLFMGGQGVDTADRQFNRADLMFMSMMVPHHEQAIEMAEMAPERTDNGKILALAENISAAQRQENRKMEGWLEEAGYEPSESAGSMAGLATEEELEQLNRSSGEEFNKLFAELMIEHHEGGIHMASMQVTNGRSEKVRDLAQSMIEAQQKEIEKMETWMAEDTI